MWGRALSMVEPRTQGWILSNQEVLLSFSNQNSVGAAVELRSSGRLSLIHCPLDPEPHGDSSGNTLWRSGISWNISWTWRLKHRVTEGPGFLVLFGRINPISPERKIQVMDFSPGFFRGSRRRWASPTLQLQRSQGCVGQGACSLQVSLGWWDQLELSSFKGGFGADDPCKHEPLRNSMPWRQMLIPPALTSSG